MAKLNRRTVEEFLFNIVEKSKARIECHLKFLEDAEATILGQWDFSSGVQFSDIQLNELREDVQVISKAVVNLIEFVRKVAIQMEPSGLEGSEEIDAMVYKMTNMSPEDFTLLSKEISKVEKKAGNATKIN